MNPLLLLFGLFASSQVLSSGGDASADDSDTLGLGPQGPDHPNADKVGGPNKDGHPGKGNKDKSINDGDGDGQAGSPGGGSGTTDGGGSGTTDGGSGTTDGGGTGGDGSTDTGGDGVSTGGGGSGTTDGGGSGTTDGGGSGDPTNVTPPTQTGGDGSGADTGDGGIPLDGTTVDAIAGRVTTLEPAGGDVASIRILEGPDHGNVTVNPDNTLALVLSGTDYTGALSFRYEITRTDGSTEIAEAKVNATAGQLSGGWGEGDHYMLEKDANGDLIIETGDNHRDIYVSNSEEALTLAEIAKLEGLSVEKITGEWLANNPEYGGTQGMALAEDAGSKLWYTLAKASYKEPASHWLHLESGYTYDSKMMHIGMRGESELNPLHITAYGEGDKPILTQQLFSAAEGVHNLVISDIELQGGSRMLEGKNILFENVTARTESVVFQNGDNITFYNSEVLDVFRDESLTDGIWDASTNRHSGLYADKVDGLLIEGSFFDHNGWEDGYDYNMSASDPMPPSQFNHNMYIATLNSDVTIRDTISMQAASFGAQVRPGGFLDGNVFLDNNAGAYVAEGEYVDGVGTGNYSLYLDNVTTSGAHKLVGAYEGRVTLGVGDYADLTAHVDNIIAHLANPDDPAEIDERAHTDPATLGYNDTSYDDTIIYNWLGGETNPHITPDQNTDGLDTDILDVTTIQRFTAQLLGKADATIQDLAQYLRTEGGGYFDGKSDAEMIVEFFQAGFGLTPDARFEAEIVRFVPTDISDGIRWDNRLNWSTEDTPGSVAGDSADLAGNWVNYGGTSEISDLYFGDGGRLEVTQGRLDVTGEMHTDGWTSQLNVDGAGQIWVDGHDDINRLNIDVDGGRFANTGDFDGKTYLDITDGQALLADEGARFDVHGDGRLKIIGDDAKVGFDGTNGGTAVLRFDEGGTLRFETGDDGAFGQIGEIRTGANGDADTNVQSGVNLGEGRLELDLSGLSGGAANYRLIDVDQMIGAFSEIDVTGLAGDRDAKLVFDYEQDAMILRITDAGAGKGVLDIITRGEDQDEPGKADLWDALTADHAPLPDDHLPDDVTVNGEMLEAV